MLERLRAPELGSSLETATLRKLDSDALGVADVLASAPRRAELTAGSDDSLGSASALRSGSDMAVGS
ncbi:MAG TPA: hypothetical protein VFQ35_21640 [Polyangiaceae bacterium]|nr:hypothetical protein [Polyangiaceae bacterium]